MVERYYDQKGAVYSTLTDQAVRKNVKDIVTLSENDVRLAEEVYQSVQTSQNSHNTDMH